jgi:hypothetical protein
MDPGMVALGTIFCILGVDDHEALRKQKFQEIDNESNGNN